MPFGSGFGGMGGGGSGRTFHFSTSSSGGGGGFSFSEPDSIFSEFLRSGAGGGGGDDNDPFFQGFGGMGGIGGSTGRFRSQSSRFASSNGGMRSRTPEVQVIEKQLPVSLEELAKGTHKKMKVQRKTFDESTGKRSVQDRILEMDIKPGLRAGSKIKFKDVGDQEEGGTQDMHFIIQEVNRSHLLVSCDQSN